MEFHVDQSKLKIGGEIVSDISELDEFNSRVAAGEANRPGVGVNRAHVDEILESSEDSPKRNGANGNVEMWAIYGGRNYSPCEQAVETLPAGQYTIESTSTIGIHLHSVDVNLDDLIDLPDSAAKTVIEEIKKFWTKEEHFRRFGFLWKRGVLLWGPPGSGKTSVLQLMSKEIIKRDGLSIYVTNPDLAARGLSLLRHVERTRPLVIMLEDVDAIIAEYGESSLLALMDGELQFDNVVFVATTNYPERLDKRFVNRPSRFDIVKKIGMPSPEARKTYISLKNPRLQGRDNKQELGMWVEQTENFSIAHLKELIISVEVFEVPFEQAVSRLKKMTNDISSADREEFGFIKK